MTKQHASIFFYIRVLLQKCLTFLCFAILLLEIGNNRLYAQSYCSNLITNGTFNNDISGWTVSGTDYYNWKYYSSWGGYSCVRVTPEYYQKKTSVLSSNSMPLAPSASKFMKFRMQVSYSAEGNMSITLGGMPVLNVVFLQSNSRFQISGASGVEVSVNGTSIAVPTTYNNDNWNTIELKILNYTGATNGQLMYSFEKQQTNRRRHIYLDDIVVAELKPERPDRTVEIDPTILPFCQGETINLNTTITNLPTLPSGLSYEWHTVANNPSSYTKVNNPTAVNQSDVYYLYTKINGADCYSEAAYDAVTVYKRDCSDSDGDGKRDYEDLDDDNDGILDTDECGSVKVEEFSGSGNFDRIWQQEGTRRIQIDFGFLDNSARIYLNGISIVEGLGYNNQLSTGLIQLQQNVLSDGEHLLVFGSPNSTDYYDSPWVPNTNGLPRFQVIIEPSGVQLKGTRYANSTTLENVYLKQGSLVDPYFLNGLNNLRIVVPPESGPTGADTKIFMERDYCQDTDGDGIINRLDLDSDNDNCPDALDGGTNYNTDLITEADLVPAQGGLSVGGGSLANSQNLGNTVDSDGVPIKVNGGQSIGGAQVPGLLRGAILQPSDVSTCIGNQVIYRARFRTPLYSTNYIGTIPAWTGGIFENFYYQWQVYDSQGWENIQNAYGEANSNTLIQLDLGVQNDIRNNGKKYRLKITSRSKGCPKYSQEARLTVRENPNVTLSVNTHQSCVGSIAPNLTFESTNSETLVVTYTVNGGAERTVEVNSSSTTVQIPTTASGVFTYTITKVAYKTSPYCEDTNPNQSICVVIFPQNNQAPTVEGANNEPIVVTDLPAVTGFTAEYSFDNGATWGANTSPTDNNCDGYNIKTRYRFTGDCAGATETVTCATSPATNRILDRETPTFTKPENLSVCVNNIIEANYDNTTNGDVDTPPDYYQFPTGYTDLDITNISDNCCTTNTITWRIAPVSNGTTISGTGQPSTALAGRRLWLDVDSNNPQSSYVGKNYIITYSVEDCNGNTSATQNTTITIKPRPKITKVN